MTISETMSRLFQRKVNSAELESQYMYIEISLRHEKHPEILILPMKNSLPKKIFIRVKQDFSTATFFEPQLSKPIIISRLLPQQSIEVERDFNHPFLKSKAVILTLLLILRHINHAEVIINY